MTPFRYQRMALSPTDGTPTVPVSEPETGWVAGPIEGAWARKWVYPVLFFAPFILFGGWFYHFYSNLKREIDDVRRSPAVVTTVQGEPSPSSDDVTIYEFRLPE